MSESSEEVPLAQRVKMLKPKAYDTEDDARSASQSARGVNGGSQPMDTDDDDDDMPLKERANQSAAKKAKRPRENGSSTTSAAKRQKAGSKIQWTTLEHGGVLFPPEYVPHGVKLKYENVPVDLTPEQEEVATMYASMLQTDYMQKDTFKTNFWEEFKGVLGKNHVIKSLEKCDFQDIHDHLMAEREKKKAMTKEEKEQVKKEKEAMEAKYKYAMVDGTQEAVGNFRVEPPGLFRGRGEHPKMGKLKRRIYPRDVTINIGEGVPAPTHPYPDQQWKAVRHDKTVTWLAYWKDPIDAKGYKYVWLSANSSFKTDADMAKYEKARKLKDHIDRIRTDYQRLWQSKDVQQQQMSTALYFIDKLALRAGHEKDEDEADTVGCCTLKVENVECMENNEIKFDFLGKDSIRYENTVTVHPKVHANIKQFMLKDGHGKKKQPEDQLFDMMDAQNLNVMMKDYLDGLSVKVFRTYNASVTLDRLLYEHSDSVTPDAKKADYDRANKEVAILCNHQRAVSKGHEDSMKRADEKIDAVKEKVDQLSKDLAAIRSKKSEGNIDGVMKKLEQAKAKMAKMIVQKNSREELKTVALGTSKINYLDPRITVAWCKRLDVPLERIFNKSLLGKFSWAMTVEPEFKF